MATGLNKALQSPWFALADLINAVRGVVKQFTEIHWHKTYTTLRVTSVVRILRKRDRTAVTGEPRWPTKCMWSNQSLFRRVPTELYWANNVLTLNMTCRLEASSTYSSYFIVDLGVENRLGFGDWDGSRVCVFGSSSCSGRNNKHWTFTES